MLTESVNVLLQNPTEMPVAGSLHPICPPAVPEGLG
jgi:hypothetical protein